MPELLIDFITFARWLRGRRRLAGLVGLEGPEYVAWLGEQPEAEYTVLMGATTYRVMSFDGRLQLLEAAQPESSERPSGVDRVGARPCGW